MKANEVRIGNLVEYDGRTFAIHIISTEFPELNTEEFGIGVISWNNVKPIPLTEEWLLKFGFTKKRDNSGDYFELKEHRVHLIQGSFEFEFNACEEERFNLFIKYQYVHQLQNLYFALTGEELTIEKP